MAIVRETDYKTLRIVLTNKAAPGFFRAEIMDITNKRNRSLATFEEPWPVPWVDNPVGGAETAGDRRNGSPRSHDADNLRTVAAALGPLVEVSVPARPRSGSSA